MKFGYRIGQKVLLVGGIEGVILRREATKCHGGINAFYTILSKYKHGSQEYQRISEELFATPPIAFPKPVDLPWDDFEVPIGGRVFSKHAYGKSDTLVVVEHNFEFTGKVIQRTYTLESPLVSKPYKSNATAVEAFHSAPDSEA